MISSHSLYHLSRSLEIFSFSLPGSGGFSCIARIASSSKKSLTMAMNNLFRPSGSGRPMSSILG